MSECDQQSTGFDNPDDPGHALRPVPPLILGSLATCVHTRKQAKAMTARELRLLQEKRKSKNEYWETLHGHGGHGGGRLMVESPNKSLLMAAVPASPVLRMQPHRNNSAQPQPQPQPQHQARGGGVQAQKTQVPAEATEYRSETLSSQETEIFLLELIAEYEKDKQQHATVPGIRRLELCARAMDALCASAPSLPASTFQRTLRALWPEMSAALFCSERAIASTPFSSYPLSRASPGGGGSVPRGSSSLRRAAYFEIYQANVKLEAQWGRDRQLLQREIEGLRRAEQEARSELTAQQLIHEQMIDRFQSLELENARLVNQAKRVTGYNEFLNQQIVELLNTLQQSTARFQQLSAEDPATHGDRLFELIEQSNAEIRKLLVTAPGQETEEEEDEEEQREAQPPRARRRTGSNSSSTGSASGSGALPLVASPPRGPKSGVRISLSPSTPGIAPPRPSFSSYTMPSAATPTTATTATATATATADDPGKERPRSASLGSQ